MEDTVTVYVWLGLLILFLVIEIATVGLTTIWMAGGALGALILDLAGIEPLVADWRISCCLVHDACIYPSVCGKIHQFPS